MLAFLQGIMHIHPRLQAFSLQNLHPSPSPSFPFFFVFMHLPLLSSFILPAFPPHIRGQWPNIQIYFKVPNLKVPYF